MKFFDNKNQHSSYLGLFNEVDRTAFPFSDIFQQKDLSQIKLIDSEEISFDNLFQIKVNVKKTGSFFFLFKKETFVKDNFVSEVSMLGEVDSNTIADVIYKVEKLYRIAFSYNALFSIYCPYDSLKLYSECFETLINGVPSFYIYNYNPSLVQTRKERKPLFVKKEKPKEEVKKVEKQPEVIEKEPEVIQKQPERVEEKHETVQKEKKERTKFAFRNPIPIIKADKYHYLFALIASFLIGFTLAIAIFDIYLGKMIYIFFIICGLVGMALNCLIYKDTFVSFPYKSMEVLVNAVISIIGVGLSIGGYFIFLALAKEKPQTNPSMLLIIGIQLLSVVLSSLTAIVLKMILNKRAKK